MSAPSIFARMGGSLLASGDDWRNQVSVCRAELAMKYHQFVENGKIPLQIA